MLTEKVHGFDMSRLEAMLPARATQLDEQIYEILGSLSNFEVFKEMMEDYKSAHEE
jgi:hypothetical protein